MPSFEIVREITAEKTFRVASVMGSFDLQTNNIRETFEGSIPLENKKWNVGVVYGASGTGKTTIAKEIFSDSYFLTPKYKSTSVVDDMPQHQTMDEITKMFTNVGFGSVPSWLKPYSVLSNGEKMRVDLAYALLSDNSLIVYDEFTSVVNRQVAKVGSTCLQKVVRKHNKQFVAVSCHEDIIDWLEPDWVFDTNTMKYTTSKKKDQLLTSEYLKPNRLFGDCLRNITI